MGRWFKRILLALAGLALLLAVAVYFGGRWAANKYLGKEYQVGAGTIRLVGPEFRWSLDVKADSAVFASPDLDAQLKGLRVSADLFHSLLRFSPTVRLEVDTALVTMRPGPDTVKPRPDSIPFPDFKLPASAVVRIGRVTVRDTAADSLAPLAQVDGIAADTRGDKAVSLAIGALRLRAMGSLVQSLAADVDWADPKQVIAKLSWHCGKDSATAEARLEKSDLLRAGAVLRARIASTAPYSRALGLDAKTPRAEAVVVYAKLGQGTGLAAEVRVDLRAEGLPQDLPIGLSAQKVALRFAFADSAGTWSLDGRGAKGETVSLTGGISAMRTDSLEDPAYLMRYAQVTARGQVRGFKVKTGGKILPADMDLVNARISANAVIASLITGDGSKLEADLRLDTAAARRAADAGKSVAAKAAGTAKAGTKGNTQATGTPGVPPWNGTFFAELAPRETWILAFTDTNVSFSGAKLSGEIRRGEMRAKLYARALKAYGVLADTLVSAHRYGRGGYTLDPSHIWRKGQDWELSGHADFGKPGPPSNLRIAHKEFGSAEARLVDGSRLEATFRGVAVEQVPYQGLDTLRANRPRLTADFAWDWAAKTGSAKVDLDGRYRKETVAMSVRAKWNAEKLTVEELRAALSGNEIKATARILLHGRQFFELAGLKPDDVEDATLGADSFDVAKAMAAVMPAPVLQKGMVVGDLGYSSASGFRGYWKVQDLVLIGENRFAVKELAIAGKGDTVSVRLVTVSEDEPLFRDTVTLAMTGLLGRAQTLAVRAHIGPGLFAAFDGGLKDFQDLRGRFSARGEVALPAGSGAVRDVRVAAQIALPLKEGIKGLSVTADTLGLVYVVPGLDMQTVTATVRMQGGKVAVPRLEIKGRDGSGLKGKMDFDPASRAFTADLNGSRVALQMGGDKVLLRELAVHAQGDSTQLTVQAAVGSGSAEHVKAPLRAAGDFSRLTAFYRTPLGSRAHGGRGSGALPLVRLSLTLDTSHVRYRLRSLESLTGIFKKEGQRKAAGRRAKPMQVQINVETSGRGNYIETDVLRMAYVGNVSMVGTYPYALMRGRITSHSGGLGTKKQSYNIKTMELKWVNVPMEEGELDLNAEKRLARTCDQMTTDSCAIRMSLTGALSDIKFSYDSDCRGSYGSGSADVSALIYSVRRGCYSPSSSSGAGGLTYQEQALGLLEPLASNYLSQAAGKLSGRWIASANVTGLGALAQDREEKPESDTGNGMRDAIGLEILSKEFWRLRLRAKSAYNLQYADEFNPWSYRVGVEWQPPIFRMVEDPIWRNRIKNKITVDAAVFTDPSHGAQSRAEDPLRRRVGLNYNYDWWGYWWSNQGRGQGVPPPAPETAAIPDTAQ